ncbi:MAG: class I SAM-dependent methyltransferase [Chloroflexota bacterium]
MAIPEGMVECRFSPDRLSRLSQLERWHFWFVGRRALIERLLNRYLNGKDQFVLDLGCGTGLMLETLMRRGYRVVGLDLRPEGLYTTRQRLPHSWLLQADTSHLPLKEEAFGVVTLLDVLEHVDDGVLLSEIYRVMQPGGWAVITVPAMPWLWSYRDEAAGHLRRYTRQQLGRMLANAHLHVQEIRYYQCLLLPLVVITRLFGRRGPAMRDLEERPLSTFNTVMTWINRIEARLSDVISWPWGSSLVVTCRRL